MSWIKSLLKPVALACFIGSLGAAENEQSSKAIELVLEAMYKDADPEITTAHIPIRMEISQIRTDCSLLQRLINGVNLCPPGYVGKITQIATEDHWKVTISGEREKSHFGRDFAYRDVTGFIQLSEDNRVLAQKNVVKGQVREFITAVDGSREIRKLALKNLDLKEDNEIAAAHAVIWVNLKKDYEKYQDANGYKMLDIEWL